MVVKQNILRTLKKMEQQYQIHISSRDPNMAIYYSKLATLEYCGWIEETLDSLIERAVKNQLKTISFKNLMKNKIKKTYGFKYDANFQPMLIYALGIIKTEKLEFILNKNGNLDILKSELENMTTIRNQAAHTHTKNGRTITFFAPSDIINKLNTLHPILKDFYSQIVKL